MSRHVGDDTGDHISDKNGLYAELTAHYWVWKNTAAADRPQFVGFFHYRRYLDLLGSADAPVTNTVFDEEAKGRFGWSQQALLKHCAQFDVTAFAWHIHKDSVYELDRTHQMMSPERWAWHASLPTHPTLAEHYCLVHRKEDLDEAVATVLRHSPEMQSAVDIALRTKNPFFLNTFIMRWELFDEYCRWLFPILSEVEQKLAGRGGPPPGFQSRVCGFLGERLLNVFLTHQSQILRRPISMTARRFVFIDESPKLSSPAAAEQPSRKP